MYTQNWRKYTTAARHMIRFYFCKSEARPDEMSPPSLNAWNACQSVMKQFNESELEIIKTYFTRFEEQANATPYTRTAKKYGLSEGDVRRIVDRCIRMVAVERGLADE